MGAKARIGLVGAGNVAQRHARVLAGFADVDLAGVTDVRPDAAHRLADTHGTRAFPDAAALLRADLDAVYVCVPPFAHGPVEEAVLDAGLPLFVEKPLAADLPTAEKVAARVNGAPTAVGHHWRYLAVVERARELLAGRPVRLVTGAWLDKVPPVAWWSQRDRSGGPVVEQAAHVLDLARLLVGEVTRVCALGDGTPPRDGGDIDSATVATLRFSGGNGGPTGGGRNAAHGGAVGTLATTSVLGWKHRAGLEIYADGLALAVGEDELRVRDGEREYRLPGDPEAARVAVDRAFVDAVRGEGDDIRVPYAEALRTHRVACAIAQSLRTGEAVDVH